MLVRGRCPRESEVLLVQDVIVDARVLSPDFVGMIAGVVSEGLHKPQFSVEGAEVVAFEIDVKVRVDLPEAVVLIPTLDVRIVARPRFKPNESLFAGLPFCFAE
jgi:hypothetical protein